jgi:cobalt-zinc-cadmium efflux system protein
MDHSQMSMPSGGDPTRALVISGWLTGVYFFIELGVGIWTGSVAVLSDAFHTFSAVGGVLIALVAARLAARPATRYQTYGLIRAEIVGALINGVFLLGMAVFVFVMGSMRLQDPKDLATIPMLAIATGGIATELISMALLYQAQKTNLNVKGAYWHILQTFAGSIIIIIAALVIQFTGFLEIDPLLGMAFGLLLFWASWSIIRSALHILLDNVPRDLDMNDLKHTIEAVPDVVSVHHLHAWSLTTGKNIVSAHVLIGDFATGEPTLQTIQSKLKSDFGIYFSTIQVETEICDEIEAADEIDFLRQDTDAEHQMPPDEHPTPTKGHH